MRIIWKPRRIFVLLIWVSVLLSISITITGYLLQFIIGTVVHFQQEPSKVRELKAFITSAYYFPKSESLGDDALALVMSINLVKSQKDYLRMQAGQFTDPTELVVMARNETTSVIVSTPYVRVTPHEMCQIVTIFATVPLIPNVKTISMVADNGMAEIPFRIPSYKKRDVVVCTSPLFVSEQWQNFLFAVHINKKFGAFMNIYFISAVTSLFRLMLEYEGAGYIALQPWVNIQFPYVPNSTVDPYTQVEWKNQAAAQTDCLLQYKESAQFITFLDLDEVIIPKIAPTFIGEFQMIMADKKRIAYMLYHKENFDVVTVRNSSKFSIQDMFGTLKQTNQRETGKIVVNPKNLNYTWIHFPPFIPNGMEKYEVEENVITHLKTITWSEEAVRKTKDEPNYDPFAEIISSTDVLDIQLDLEKMMRKPNVRKIVPDLPTKHYFSDTLGNCHSSIFHRFHYSIGSGETKCPGSQSCGFKNHPKIQCMHVNATHIYMEPLFPITYYYATGHYFTGEMGCYAH